MKKYEKERVGKTIDYNDELDSDCELNEESSSIDEELDEHLDNLIYNSIGESDSDYDYDDEQELDDEYESLTDKNSNKGYDNSRHYPCYCKSCEKIRKKENKHRGGIMKKLCKLGVISGIVGGLTYLFYKKWRKTPMPLG